MKLPDFADGAACVFEGQNRLRRKTQLIKTA
jgi:hypothetical protein